MSLFSILDTLLIGPLKLAFEIIYAIAIKFIVHPGYTIIAFSLVMNILVLPLYRRADAMQEQARDIEEKLSKGVNHIKKTFSGDERMMILQTYYRQNNYKPTDALRGSVSLLLEIPFFMAAYQFLSNLDAFRGVSMGPISDLSQPDAILVIGSLTFNLLPVLMTLINVISSAIYLKGFPLKTKVQLYGMALFFLVFLYNSPAGLVFYWTLNNLFSLVKTIFYKLKHPKRILCVLCSLAGLTLPFVAKTYFLMGSHKREVFITVLAVVLQVPLFFPLLKKLFPWFFKPTTAKPNRKLFLMGSLFVAILTGLLIPSTFIAASPQEFVDASYFHHPLWYLVSSGCLAFGFFLIWMRVFYWLANDSGKVLFDRMVWVLAVVMLVNYMFFGTNLGVISSSLQYEFGVNFVKQQQLENVLILGVIALITYLLSLKWSRAASAVLLAGSLALGGMSALNVATIRKSISEVSLSELSATPSFQLSKTGQNVVVIMLDRAMGQYVPYLFNEKPELKEEFAGFTYYSNTISHGGYTNFGTPTLYGGYEYTPVEMNKRSDENLVDKHNEALLVLPVLFSENDFDVTVCDPPYSNYQWIPDLTPFKKYPEIESYLAKGKFTDEVQKRMYVENNHRNFFVFSLMKTMPLFTQRMIYNNGLYLHQRSYNGEEAAYSIQVRDGLSRAEGIFSNFMEGYNTLVNLSSMTEITEEETNTFLIMSNDLTHEVMLLQEPDYTPSWVVDNTEYDEANAARFTLDGRELIIRDEMHMMHYQTNMAALLLVGDWLNYLRENGVYDNTRIILVSDHGRELMSVEELMMGGSDSATRDIERFYPLLMVKDFNSTEFITSDEFMTNADTPTLAVQNLLENAVNPFTGKEINMDEKTAHEQFVTLSWDYNTYENNGKTYLPSQWASVKDNLWDADNWTFYEGTHVLSEHKAP